jgi:hypothetical protein
LRACFQPPDHYQPAFVAAAQPIFRLRHYLRLHRQRQPQVEDFSRLGSIRRKRVELIRVFFIGALTPQGDKINGLSSQVKS